MSRCPDALICEHTPTSPTEPYVAARTDTDLGTILRTFPRWPARHVAAIIRARREHPGRARELARLEAVQRGMRRVDGRLR